MENAPSGRLELARKKVQAEHATGLARKLFELSGTDLPMEVEQEHIKRHVEGLFEQHWADPLWKSELTVFAHHRNCSNANRSRVQDSYVNALQQELDDSRKAARILQKK